MGVLKTLIVRMKGLKSMKSLKFRATCIATFIFSTFALEGCTPPWVNQGAALGFAPSGNPTVIQKTEVFDRIWILFDKFYPYFKWKNVNWETEKRRFEPQALAATSWSTFFQVCEKMIGTLHDAHSGILGSPYQRLNSAPVLLDDVQGRPIVAWVASTVGSVKPGMEVYAVNGQDVSDLIHLREQENGYTYGYQDSAEIAQLLLTPNTKNEMLTVGYPGSSKRSIRLAVNSDVSFSTIARELNGIPNFQWTPWERNVTLQWLPGRVAYIKIPTMDDYQPAGLQQNMANLHLWSQIEALIPKLNEAHAAIIDVRGNTGGNMYPSIWLAQHFFTNPVTANQFTERNGNPYPYMVPQGKSMGKMEETPKWLQNTFRFQQVSDRQVQTGFTTWQRIRFSPVTPHLHMPVAVLIDEGDASASENFIMAMSYVADEHSFGTRTAGADASPVDYSVMKGVTMYISRWNDIYLKTGHPIEDVGIQPDVSVPITYTDFRVMLKYAQSGRSTIPVDPVINRALAWLNQQGMRH